MDYTPELPPYLRAKQSAGHDTAEDDFCPQLPPHLLSKEEDSDDFCPQLPAHLIKKPVVEISEDEFCPQLPSHLSKKGSSGVRKENDIDSEDEFCPTLPPHLTKKAKVPKILGPTLPSNYKLPACDLQTKISDDSSSDDDIQGPVHGPLPPSKPVDMDKYIEDRMQRRTNAIKEKMTKKVCILLITSLWICVYVVFGRCHYPKCLRFVYRLVLLR